MDMNLSKLQEIVKDRGARHAAVQWSQGVRHDLATQQPVLKKGEKNPDLYAHIYSFIKYVLVVM